MHYLSTFFSLEKGFDKYVFEVVWFPHMSSETQFIQADGTSISLAGVLQEVSQFMREKKDAHYKIIVGSDSLGTLGQYSDFVTAIVVQRVGNGGRYFWRRVGRQEVFGLRDRIIKEVLLSLEAAQQLTALLLEMKETCTVEVHVDVGTEGKTNPLIKEVVGMIQGYNFMYKTKPDSYAASSVADRHI